MSLFTGVTGNHKLAGVVGMSAYLLLGDKAREMGEARPGGLPNKDTPFFMAHGDSDPLVKPEWGTLTAEMLKKWGHTVDFRTYK